MNKINKFIIIGVVVSAVVIGFVPYTFNYYKTTYNKISIVDWGRRLHKNSSDSENVNIETTESEKVTVDSGDESAKEQNNQQDSKFSAENSQVSTSDDALIEEGEPNTEDSVTEDTEQTEQQTVEETVDENQGGNDNPKETNEHDDSVNTNNELNDTADEELDNREETSNNNINDSNETTDSTNQETSDNINTSEEEEQENNNEESSIDIGNIKAFVHEVVQLMSSERVNEGLSPLGSNSKLSDVARVKSQDMIDNEYFSHLSPTYGSPFDMMKDFGISYMTAGENIAYGQSTPAEVMNSWMNSEGHRSNILNPAFTEIGVGVAVDANGRYYWTQMFIGN